MNIAAPTAWWRPAATVTAAARLTPIVEREGVAFAALIAFTVILLVSPQAWFPAIKSLRIALLAAGVAIAAHAGSRAFGRTPALPVRREVVLALSLIAW